MNKIITIFLLYGVGHHSRHRILVEWIWHSSKSYELLLNIKLHISVIHLNFHLVILLKHKFYGVGYHYPSFLSPLKRAVRALSYVKKKYLLFTKFCVFIYAHIFLYFLSFISFLFFHIIDPMDKCVHISLNPSQLKVRV